jgi:arginyl-tRNA synthetase
MYSVARARSILRKYNKKTPELSEFNNINLENIEKILINEFNKYPLIIELASKKDNPAILTEYLLNLS